MIVLILWRGMIVWGLQSRKRLPYIYFCRILVSNSISTANIYFEDCWIVWYPKIHLGELQMRAALINACQTTRG